MELALVIYLIGMLDKLIVLSWFFAVIAVITLSQCFFMFVETSIENDPSGRSTLSAFFAGGNSGKVE